MSVDSTTWLVTWPAPFQWPASDQLYRGHSDASRIANSSAQALGDDWFDSQSDSHGGELKAIEASVFGLRTVLSNLRRTPVKGCGHSLSDFKSAAFADFAIPARFAQTLVHALYRCRRPALAYVC